MKSAPCGSRPPGMKGIAPPSRALRWAHGALRLLNSLLRRTRQRHRILLVRQGYVGDIIQTTALLRDLRQFWPDAHLMYMTGTGGAGALNGNADVREIVPYVRAPRIRLEELVGFVRRILSLRRRGVGLGISLNPGSWDALLLHLVGAERCVGFVEPGREFLLDECIVWDETKVVARQEHYDDLLRLLGLEPVCRQYELALPAESSCSEEVRRVLAASEPVVAIAPGGGYNPAGCAPYRQWPAERFAEVVTHFLSREGVRVILVGGHDDTEVARRVMNCCPDVATGALDDLTGRTSLAELGLLLSKADLLITNDSAPVWVAAAVRCSTVCIVGCNHPVVCTPLSSSFAAVSAQLPCSPCFSGAAVPKCQLPAQCLQNITVAQVLAAVRELEARRESNPGQGSR